MPFTSVGLRSVSWSSPMEVRAERSSHQEGNPVHVGRGQVVGLGTGLVDVAEKGIMSICSCLTRGEACPW